MSEYIVRMPSDMPYEIKAELNAWYVNSEPIVRCRDCKHGYKDVCERPIWGDGERACAPIEPDGFCAWGERKRGAKMDYDAAEYQAAINPNTDFDR